MLIDQLKSLWTFIDGLSSQVKTLIIVLIVGYFISNKIITENANTLSNWHKEEELRKVEAEKYAKDMAADINFNIQSILDKDTAISNVLLLSYHNSQKSLQDFNYQFLNCLAEKVRGLETLPVKQEWSELSYVYYADELELIGGYSFLQISDIKDMRKTMPKLYRKLLASEAIGAAMYPIQDRNDYIGMIVIIYKEPKTFEDNYYTSVVHRELIKLSSILNYKEVSKK